VGVVIIVIGLVSLLENLHFLDAGLVRPLWPLVFVVAGVLKLQQTRHSGSGALVGGALIVIGAAMTLQGYGFMHIRMRDWWPVALIGAGLYVIARGVQNRDGRAHDAAPEEGGATGPTDATGPFDAPLFGSRGEHRVDSSRLDASAVMAGSVVRNDSPDIQGGEITVAMGGLEIDLRHAAMKSPEVVLHVFVMFGGLVLKVPPGWSVVARGTPILGGIEDKTVPAMNAAHRLVIDGYVIMGGVEIKN
jgi:predicted membrane protein